MKTFLKSLLVEEEGASLIEYGLLVSLIAAAAITVVGTLTTAMGTKFTAIAGQLN